MEKILKQQFLFRLLAVFISISALSLQAAVDYTEWSGESISDLIYQAQSKDQMILVNVTQPDWCPPCIRLENAIFKNPEEKEFAKLAENWIALEVYGYDQEGADFLETQNLRFHGTPTIFLLDPKRITAKSKAELSRNKLKNKKPTLRLGDIKIVHSIAGFPDDFTAQLDKASNGYDLVAEAQKSVRNEQTLAAYKALALAYVDQGQVSPANRVYQSILLRNDLSAEDVQAIEWEQIFQVTQRVLKDHEKSVIDIDAFIEKYPSFIKDKENFETYAYRRAWSLVEIDRVDEANMLLKKAYVEPNEIDGLSSYLYFAFRNPEPVLLADAKVVCDQALKTFPDSESRLKAAEARLLRRMGKMQESKASFIRAISLLDPKNDDDAENIELYKGQLAFVNAEIAKKVNKNKS